MKKRMKMGANYSLFSFSLYDFMYYTVNANYFEIINMLKNYEGWNFNSGNYLFTTDTK